MITIIPEETHKTLATLHKTLLKAYNDPGIVAALTDLLYDSIGSFGGSVEKFVYNDQGKYFIFTIPSNGGVFTAEGVSELFKIVFYRFVCSLFDQPMFATLMNSYGMYDYFRSMKDYRADAFLEYVYSCVAILNLTGINSDTINIRINLHN